MLFCNFRRWVRTSPFFRELPNYGFDGWLREGHPPLHVEDYDGYKQMTRSCEPDGQAESRRDWLVVVGHE